MLVARQDIESNWDCKVTISLLGWASQWLFNLNLGSQIYRTGCRFGPLGSREVRLHPCTRSQELLFCCSWVFCCFVLFFCIIPQGYADFSLYNIFWIILWAHQLSGRTWKITYQYLKLSRNSVWVFFSSDFFQMCVDGLRL